MCLWATWQRFVPEWFNRLNDSVQSQWFVPEWFNRLNDSVQSQWFVPEWFNRLNDSVQSQWFVPEWFNRLNDSVQSLWFVHEWFNESLKWFGSVVVTHLLPVTFCHQLGILISHLKSIFVFKIILNLSIQCFMFKM